MSTGVVWSPARRDLELRAMLLPLESLLSCIHPDSHERDVLMGRIAGIRTQLNGGAS